MILWCNTRLLKAHGGLAAMCKGSGSTASSCPLDPNAGMTSEDLMVCQGKAFEPWALYSTMVVRDTFLKGIGITTSDGLDT